jgi:enhancing lycopene biosynthesis protein 2
LSEFQVNDFDALILPGGYGVAKNLSNFALNGTHFSVIESVENAIKQMHFANKPIGALCISPVIIAKVLHNCSLTIGQDLATAEVITQLGSNHHNTNSSDIVVDRDNRIVTTPCYMLEGNIYEVSKGIDNLVTQIIEMC